MTKSQHRAAERYIRRIADELRLRDWTVLLDPEPSSEGTSATVTPIYGRRRAIVYLSADFLETSAEEQRHTVAHELIHLHLEPCSATILNDLQAPLGENADTILERVYMRHLEYAVDGLADAVAPMLPLPPWTS